MSGAALLLHQVRYEQKQYWRNPAAAGFSVVFPLMFLVIFASINRDSTIHQYGVNYNQYYIPAILCFGVLGATFTNLAVSICVRRDAGLLKRLRGTPLPVWAYMAGVIGNAIIVSLLLVTVTTAAGALFYGVHIYAGRLPGLALSIAVAALAFCALGLALSAAIPNADAAPAIANFIVLPITFISGVFFTVAQGSFVDNVAGLFPLRHFIVSVYGAFDPYGSGPGFSGHDLLVVAGWGAAGVLITLRRFRWEPRR